MNKTGDIDQIAGNSAAASPVLPSPLTDFEIQSIDLFVRLAHMVSIPKSVGEIYGLLFASPSPLSFDDIVTRLNMSKGSASQGLRLLRLIGAAKSTYVAGERRDYFLAEIELRKLVVGFLNEQVRPHLTTGRERLAVMANLVAGEPESRREVLKARVRKLESWRSATASALPAVVGLLGKATISKT